MIGVSTTVTWFFRYRPATEGAADTTTKSDSCCGQTVVVKSVMVGEVVKELRGMFGSPRGNIIGRLALLMEVQTRNSQKEKVHRPSHHHRVCVAPNADRCLLKCNGEQRLRALRALAWVVPPMSCGIVQQGVGPRGSAGAKTKVFFEVPPCH